MQQTSFFSPTDTSDTRDTIVSNVSISKGGDTPTHATHPFRGGVSDVSGARAATVLGIDPGVSGAIAVLDVAGDLLDVIDMPILRDGSKGRATVNAPLLAAIIRETGAATAFVEFVGSRPGEGAVGAFAFGRCKGGTAAALGVPVTFLTPPVWKRVIGIPPGKDGAKDAARSEAIRRWPSQAARFARVKDDGRAEAALIALAGLLKGRPK